MALWRLLVGYQRGWIWEKLGPPLKQAQACVAPLENPRWTARSCCCRCCCFRTRSWLGVSEGRGGSAARQLLAKLSRGGGAVWRPLDASRSGGVASMWQPGARGGASWCGAGRGAAPRLSRASFGGAVERPWLVSVSRRAVHRNMNEAEGLRQRRPARPQVLTEENAAQAVKDSSTYSNRIFRVTFMTLAVSLIIPLFGALIFLDCPIDPQPISFKEPPPLTGALEPNVKLRQAERLFENQLVGPESITNIGVQETKQRTFASEIYLFLRNGCVKEGLDFLSTVLPTSIKKSIQKSVLDVLFTGTADGKILKIENGKISTLARLGHGPCGTREDEPTCGRPLGIRVGPNNTLFVLDAYYGLFEINPVSGAVRPLVSSKIPIEGKNMSFVNDLTMTRDGRKIYFTDSSSKWQRKDYSLLIMEASDDGRLFEYDTVTKEVKVLMEGLRFPNGVQLSPAEDFVLVAETVMARIRRYYVSGLMKGGEDLFVENMPGFPDNIRLSSSGGYWVAMSAIRANPGFSMVDFLSEKPWIKRIIFKLLSQETVIKFVPKYSLVVELSDTGSYRRSFHDPNGMVATYISEAHEYNGHLYLGSFQSPFICRLDLKDV